ncbi:MAG: fibronectin type III domain-containing protein [Thermodesulfobacteriota bacterium]
MTGIRRLTLYSALILVVFLITSCGRKTDPIPPQAAIPAPVKDLSYRFSDRGLSGHQPNHKPASDKVNEVILEWTYPRKSINGQEIKRIRRFLLHKSDLTGKNYCPDCPATVTSVKKIKPLTAGPGQKMQIRDRHLVPGHHYYYSVISDCGWNIISQESNRISFWWDTPPAAPSPVRVKTTEQGVKISWEAVENDIKGASLDQPLKYQVLRKRGNGKYRTRGETTKRPWYYDQVAEGDEYSYRIRAIKLYKGTAIPGQYSKTVNFTPEDRTPPPTPEIVSIIKSGHGPRLLWKRVSAPDLGGYRVYRRRDRSAKWTLIVETGPHAFSFTDKSLSDKKGPWYYTVTSFDNASPANESNLSGEAVYKLISD